jgi:hypothetical protein
MVNLQEPPMGRRRSEADLRKANDLQEPVMGRSQAERRPRRPSFADLDDENDSNERRRGSRERWGNEKTNRFSESQRRFNLKVLKQDCDQSPINPKFGNFSSTFRRASATAMH